MITRSRLRYLVPVAALGAVLAAPSVAGPLAAADPGLPQISAQQLLADTMAAKPQALSGDLTQTMDLGLPELPMTGPHGAEGDLTSPLTLLSGTHQWRVWSNGSDASRLALVDGNNETSIVTNPKDTWVYNSRTQEAIHASTPAHAASGGRADGAAPRTPQQLAEQALAAVTPTTEVSVGTQSTVAGRAAYTLVLTPKDATTRIARVSISVDGATKLPLRVTVDSAQGQTGIDVGFTRLDLSAPPARTFEYTPAAGVKVVEAPKHAAESSKKSGKSTSGAAKRPGVRASGTGWSQVLVAKADALAGPRSSDSPQGAEGQAPGEAAQLLDQLPTVSGAWGSGKLLNGTLVSAVLTDDGRIAVGAVAPEALYAALQ